jgi:hypothetical protein
VLMVTVAWRCNTGVQPVSLNDGNSGNRTSENRDGEQKGTTRYVDKRVGMMGEECMLTRVE